MEVEVEMGQKIVMSEWILYIHGDGMEGISLVPVAAVAVAVVETVWKVFAMFAMRMADWTSSGTVQQSRKLLNARTRMRWLSGLSSLCGRGWDDRVGWEGGLRGLVECVGWWGGLIGWVDGVGWVCGLLGLVARGSIVWIGTIWYMRCYGPM